jgi:transcriptional regulator with PAS, ATPase and Fis domain
LRERKDDIPLLADYFLGKFARGGAKKVPSRDAMDLLRDYRWPGNVRELANVMERAVLLCASREAILPEDLPQSMMEGRLADSEPDRREITSADELSLHHIEQEHIERVLSLARGNKSKAARLLGISRRKLYLKTQEK